MKDWQRTLFGIFLGMIFSGIILVISPPGRSEMILLPTHQVDSVTIYVSGEVNNPGVYSLEAGSQVNNAIQAAGGFTLQANVEALNLAAKLDDEDRITIPDKNNSVPPTAESDNNSLININSATVEDLDKLPGVGKVKAETIIEF